VLLAWKNNGATAPERARSTGSALGAWIVAARCKAWPTDARRIRSAIINRAINPDLEIGKNKRRSRMSRRKAEAEETTADVIRRLRKKGQELGLIDGKKKDSSRFRNKGGAANFNGPISRKLNKQLSDSAFLEYQHSLTFGRS
jgi:hypothetical protein